MVKIYNRRSDRILSLYEKGGYGPVSEYLEFNVKLFVEEYENNNYGRFESLCDKFGFGKSFGKRILKVLGKLENRMGKNSFNLSDFTKSLINNKEWLTSQLQTKTLTQIACELNVNNDTIRRRLRQFNISIDIPWDYKINKVVNKSKLLYDREYMYREYVTDQKTAQQIANEIGVSQQTVLTYLRKHRIETRLDGQWQYRELKDLLNKLTDKKFMIEQYITLKKSTYQIACELGTNDVLVGRHLRRLGIQMRSHLEYADLMSSVHKHKLIPLLDKYGINHVSSYVVRMREDKNWSYEIDEYLPDYRVFLELNGLYWHGYGNLNLTVARNIQRDIVKWKNLTSKFPDHKIVYMLESDFEDGLADRIIEGIVGRKRELAKWKPDGYRIERCNKDDVYEFIANNHYLKSIPASKFIFGLYNKNQLVAAVVFSYPHRNEQLLKYGENTVEISRFISLEHGSNANSWFISKCLREVSNRPIISYADITRYPGKISHDGTLYKACNFEYIGLTESSYRYLTPDRKLLHKRGVWKKAKRNGITEKRQAYIDGLIKVLEWPKKIFIYRR